VFHSRQQAHHLAKPNITSEAHITFRKEHRINQPRSGGISSIPQELNIIKVGDFACGLDKQITALRLLFVVKDYPKGTYPRENHLLAHMCASTNWNALLCLDGFDLPTHTSGREWASEISHVQKDCIQLSAGFEGIPFG
jgi:hypothetical protein